MKLFGSSNSNEHSTDKKEKQRGSKADSSGIDDYRLDTPENSPDGETKPPGRGKKRALIALAVVAGLCAALFIGWKIFTLEPEIGNGGPVVVAVSPTPAQNEPEITPEPDPEPQVEGSARRPKTFTFVVAASDDSSGATDTLILAMFDTIERELNCISIPRDTLVNSCFMQYEDVKKVNQAYKWGGVSMKERMTKDDWRSGTDEEKAQALLDQMRDLTGIEIDFYVVIDIEGFVALVDTIGGVEFDVPRRMFYTDPEQDLNIDLQPGIQTLYGNEAIQLVRFRKNNDPVTFEETPGGYTDGDIGRIKTQQDFMAATARQVLQIGNVTKAKQFAKIFTDYVDTNLSVRNIAWLGEEFLKMDAEDISFMKIPAWDFSQIDGTSYVTILVDEWLDMINECLSPYTEEHIITEENVNILTFNWDILTVDDSHISLSDGEEQFYVTNGGSIAGGIQSFYPKD